MGGDDTGHGWIGGEFTPANRLPTSSSDQPGARTKRYSSQRLRGTPTAAALSDTSCAGVDDAAPTSLATAAELVSATSMVHMPPRPMPNSAFYGI